MKIILIALLCYILSYILNRILTYISGIIHAYCRCVLYEFRFWFKPNMTIRDLINEISLGEYFNVMTHIKWTPIVNCIIPIIWLCCELFVVIFVIFICILRYFVYIYDTLNISNSILKIKHFVHVNKICYVTIIIYNKICNCLYQLKNKFLNIKIS